MSYSIRIDTTVYAPWEDDEDFPTEIDALTTTQTFETARELADFLGDEDLTEPSESVPHGAHSWLGLPDGSRPHESHGLYTGEREEITAHNVNVPPRLWHAIVNTVACR